KTSSKCKTRYAGSLNYTKPVTRNSSVVLTPVLFYVTAESARDPRGTHISGVHVTLSLSPFFFFSSFSSPLCGAERRLASGGAEEEAGKEEGGAATAAASGGGSGEAACGRRRCRPPRLLSSSLASSSLSSPPDHAAARWPASSSSSSTWRRPFHGGRRSSLSRPGLILGFAGVELYRQGASPVAVFRSALVGPRHDRLQVGAIQAKHGLHALFAFKPEASSGGLRSLP
ncbi:Os03g0204600, partial [Oryza sativa Japonica Group]